MTFLEFVDIQDQLSTVRTSIMNSLGATNDALDDPLINFKDYRKLLDTQRNPQFTKLISDAKNKGAIVKAIENASITKISIADLISLFRAGISGDLPGGRKAPNQNQPQDSKMSNPSNPKPTVNPPINQSNIPKNPNNGAKIPGIG